MSSVTGLCFYTKAGYVSIQSNIFEVPLGCLHLCGVALDHVIHGKHGFLTELSVVIKIDLSIKANHWGKDADKRREVEDNIRNNTKNGNRDKAEIFIYKNLKSIN